MWISKKEFNLLKSDISYLDRRLDDERDKRWKYEARLDAVLDHLGLEIVHVPPTRVIRLKETK